MFFLVDCNNFYASCEILFQPELIGVPLVVLSNNDGCVVSRSPEARALGIKTGTPAFRMREEIRRGEIKVRSSNHTLYGEMSTRVMNRLRRWSDQMEVYSIDEAFLKIPSRPEERQRLGEEIRAAIRKEIGISVGVGIAPTKTLAKAANGRAKKGGTGVWMVESEEQRRELLEGMEAGEVWGIGRGQQEKLAGLGIKTAWQLAEGVSEQRVDRVLGVVGSRIIRELRGESALPLRSEPAIKQSATVSRTFAEATDQYEVLADAVRQFTFSVTAKIRQEGLSAGRITLSFRTDRFRTNAPQYSPSGSFDLPSPSDDPFVLTAAASRLLRELYLPRFRYRKAGITLTDLVPSGEVQLSLFDGFRGSEAGGERGFGRDFGEGLSGGSGADRRQANGGDRSGERGVADAAGVEEDRSKKRERRPELLKAIDAIRNRYGKESLAPPLLCREGKWQFRQEQRSGRYTTRWDEIMEIRT